MRHAWVVVLAALVLPSCKGDAGGTTNATPPVTTPPCERSTLLERGSALEANGGYVFLTFATTQVGRIEVAVDWTFAASDVRIYLVEEACTIDHLLGGGGCQALAFSETGPKPRRATYFAGPGRYALIVVNLGTADEAVSSQITLSSSGCPTITATEPASR